MAVRYLLLGCGWMSWCVLHSLLVSPVVTGFIQRLPEPVKPYLRLVYNIIALATLVPLAGYTRHLAGGCVFAWQGGWLMVRFLMLGLAFLLFYGGARHYDMGYFLGLRQIATGRSPVQLTEDAPFARDGIFAVVRHPWYLASLLLLWSILPVYTRPAALAAVILSVYLPIGATLEERKLAAEFGVAYRTYQRQVSMFLPWKWLRAAWKSGD
ncbi:MAG: hypothetical protein P4L42_00150 [Desulfocapsaceae bacterium]|nr:hypothetical protein [Desulfocapsaceae bacterium]